MGWIKRTFTNGGLLWLVLGDWDTQEFSNFLGIVISKTGLRVVPVSITIYMPFLTVFLFCSCFLNSSSRSCLVNHQRTIFFDSSSNNVCDCLLYMAFLTSEPSSLTIHAVSFQIIELNTHFKILHSPTIRPRASFRTDGYSIKQKKPAWLPLGSKIPQKQILCADHPSFWAV